MLKTDVSDHKLTNNVSGRLEELEDARSALLNQLSAATQREETLRDDVRNFERTIALLKHEVKEALRKADVELEAKKNLENNLQDMKRKLEEEQGKRSREMSNSHQTNEKISSLEKQVI
jgi:chromosome segregation ATPase